jgi:uncharacterized Zn-binding protein involved in type VI secretion
MPPAARVGDLHACPVASHVGGPVTDGSPTVNIGGAPAARVGDHSRCSASQDTIVQGSPTVFIEGRPAVRSGDRCAHSGVILTGFESVIIGNNGNPSGGGAAAPGAEETVKDGASVSGTKVSNQVLNSVVSLARQLIGGGGLGANQGAIQAASTQLEVALARNDLDSVQSATVQLQQLLQQAGVKVPGADHIPKPEMPAKDAAQPTVVAPTAIDGWQSPGSLPAEAIQTVVVRDGRIAVNEQFVGLHAISEFDLIELQATGFVERIIGRLTAARAAGRNCARIFCMYQNARDTLSPWTTPGYWSAVDAVVKRLAVYGLFGVFVLLADCDRRPDGTGGVMPSWDDRRAFVREAAQFFKGKPVIVSGMNEPFRSGAAGADDPRLVEIMRLFRDVSEGTVPFSIADPRWTGDQDAPLARSTQQTLAASGAALIVVHAPRERSDRKRYRAWIDRLMEFGDLRSAGLSGNPYLYHSEPIGFAGRKEDGKRDDDAEAAAAAATVCAIGQMGFCYHRIASDDPATPGLQEARIATLVPQSPDFTPYEVGAEGSPIASIDQDDFPGGSVYCCSNGREAWGVGYGKHVIKTPRVVWRDLTPEVIWRGERVILWRAG